MKCLICNLEGLEGKKFTEHVLSKHKVKSEEYTWKYILSLDKRPVCKVEECKNLPRYCAFKFKKYCKEHSRIAEVEGGKYGGKIKETWNKGKTAEEDSRIVRLSGDQNGFFGKTHTEESLNKIKLKIRVPKEELFKRIENSISFKYFQPNFDYDKEYVSRQKYYSFLCRFCNRDCQRSIVDIERGTRCHNCFNVGSIQEEEVYLFINSFGIDCDRNSRKIIPPKEIDIFCKEKKLGIEYHGLFWHSGGITNDVNKKLHRQKYLMMKEKGCKLLQIFSDEWEHKKDICKSMIQQRLGINQIKIGARKLHLSLVDKKVSKEFFDSNHISGNCPSSFCVGLFNENKQLISAMSFRKPVQKRYKNTIELARFATKLNHICSGAASRIMKFSEDEILKRGFDKILSYSDLRFGDGNVYLNCGFERQKDTGIDYFYTDGSQRFNRFKYRAQDGMTENDYAISQEVFRVYGCGHAVYLKQLQKSRESLLPHNNLSNDIICDDIQTSSITHSM